jgi:hypothetical protein
MPRFAGFLQLLGWDTSSDAEDGSDVTDSTTYPAPPIPDTDDEQAVADDERPADAASGGSATRPLPHDR